MDIFEREQLILNSALSLAIDMQSGAPCSADEFTNLAIEYGRLLKHLQGLTKLSEKNTHNINTY